MKSRVSDQVSEEDWKCFVQRTGYAKEGRRQQRQEEEEVLEFVRAAFGRPLHVEEDVGLGLDHRLLVRLRHRAVVEVEPAAFVRGVGGVVAGADPGGQRQTGGVRWGGRPPPVPASRTGTRKRRVTRESWPPTWRFLGCGTTPGEGFWELSSKNIWRPTMLDPWFPTWIAQMFLD